MSEKKRTKKKRSSSTKETQQSPLPFTGLSRRKINIIGALVFLFLTLVFTLSSLGLAGVVGRWIYDGFLFPVFGYGVVMVILSCLGLSLMFTRDTMRFTNWKGWLSFVLIYITFLGFADVLFYYSDVRPGGWVGSLATLFAEYVDVYLATSVFTMGFISMIFIFVFFWDWKFVIPADFAVRFNTFVYGHPEGALVAMRERERRIMAERGEQMMLNGEGLTSRERIKLAEAEEDAEFEKRYRERMEAFFADAQQNERIDWEERDEFKSIFRTWRPHDPDLKTRLKADFDKRLSHFKEGLKIDKERAFNIENGEIEALRGETPEGEPELINNERSLPSTYTPPPISLLAETKGTPRVGDIKANANLIKRTLHNFGIDVEMDEVSVGPTVTRYALKPAEGVKLSRIVGLQNDLALALAAHPLRIEAPIPGKALVGIEIPNKSKATIGLASLLSEDEFTKSPHPLLVCLGKGVTGKSYYANIAKMPHLLIAGATGSGKSVTVHNIIASLLYRNGPQDLRLIMVDPKRVELTLYNKIPHLLTPVIKQPKKAIIALKWAVKEMERRYDVLESESVRDIDSYHKTIVEPAYAKVKKDGDDGDNTLPERMPYIVIIIDELSDLMQAYPRELEAAIVRLAQMSRAVGIHLILSTQRPSVNVITGLIKANVPARIALQVSSQIDSRTILDTSGAEKLLGQGDMLYSGAEVKKPMRMQSAFISEDEVKAIADHLIGKNDELVDEISLSEDDVADASVFSMTMDDDDEEDPLYEEARDIVIEEGKASTSYLQRKLKIGYSRAARIIDLLEERNIVGPANGSKPREIVQHADAFVRNQKTLKVDPHDPEEGLDPDDFTEEDEAFIDDMAQNPEKYELPDAETLMRRGRLDDEDDYDDDEDYGGDEDYDDYEDDYEDDDNRD